MQTLFLHKQEATETVVPREWYAACECPAGAILGHGLCTALAVVGGNVLAKRISERVVLVLGGQLTFTNCVQSGMGSPGSSTQCGHLLSEVLLWCIFGCLWFHAAVAGICFLSFAAFTAVGEFYGL